MFVDENGKRWYKGNLHTHTTCSDGLLPPDAVIAQYQAKDYDFLAITDHWNFRETAQEDGFLLLSGAEYDIGHTLEEGIYHIVGVGMEREPQLKTARSPQDLIDGIHAVGGLAILAHPAWSMNRAEEVNRLAGLDGCEIYNTVSGLPWNCRPYSGCFLDDLAGRGNYLPCMAADDAHNYMGDQTRSYLMVQADELAPDAVLEAIRKRHFYATQDPRFSVEQQGDRFLVHSTPVQSIVFFTDSIYEQDRATCGDGICEAEFRIKNSTRFIRVELTDADGKMAWSSYYLMKDNG